MSQEVPSGRSRGRARGRARGQVQDPARRPGDVPPTVQQMPAQVPVQPPTGGRASHRGGSRGELKPGESSHPPTSEMASLSIGGRGDVSDVSTRPLHITDKRGVSGQPFKVLTNFFKVISRPNWCVYQYHVEFAPTVESVRVRRALLYDRKDMLGSCFTFDGMSDLKTTTKLPQDINEFVTERKTDKEKITIKIKRVASLAPDHPELTRLFNTQMRRNLQHLQFLLLGRHYFDKNAVSDISRHGLEVWQGVVTSIRQQETDVMMLVDTVHKVLRKDTVLDQLADISRRSNVNQQDACDRELVGTIVMTKYNNRTYRVDGIDWNLNPVNQFETKEGTTTYVDYYKKQYDIDIKDRRQPLLVCCSKEKELRKGAVKSKQVYLIPELCCMTGLTDSMRSDFILMKDIASQTRIIPERRVQNLCTFINRVNNNPNVRQEMNAWGLQFDEKLVEINARIIPPESIIQRGIKSSFDSRTAEFSKEIRNKRMHAAVDLTKWLIICTKRDKPKCEDFMANIQRVCPPMGMNYTPPNVRFVDDDRTNTFLQELRANYSPDLQMAVFIVPNNRKDRYDAIKKMACIDLPVASQVIVGKTLAKRQTLMSVATKIGIQLNCKMGGEPWAVEIPLKMPVMIVGYDAYHDSSRKGHSAGAFIASMNQSFTRWFSQVSFHSAGAWHELSDHLHIHMTAALKEYHQRNKVLPQMVIFYRDGVGDGQIKYVRDYEVTQINNTFSSLSGGDEKYCPKFGFIVVNKRIGTRFFAVNGQGVTNPPPGCVVDTEVTRFNRYDFFLVSQSVKQGTVSPTQYNVIADTTGLKPDHIQRLTYKLTHLYYNWPGTIRVPAPCQYAHKLAFLSGQSLHREPHSRLSDRLFYL